MGLVNPAADVEAGREGRQDETSRVGEIEVIREGGGIEQIWLKGQRRGGGVGQSGFERERWQP